MWKALGLGSPHRKKKKVAAVQLAQENDSAQAKGSTQNYAECNTDEDCPEDQVCDEYGTCVEVSDDKKKHISILAGIAVALMVASLIIAITACVRHSWKLGNGKCTTTSSKNGVSGGQRMRLINDLTICTWLFLGFPVLNLGLSSGLMHNVNQCGQNMHT